MSFRVNMRLPKGTQGKAQTKKRRLLENRIKTNAKGRFKMKNQTIGIEIELTGITRETAAKTIASYFGTAANYIGGGYKAYEIADNGGRIWSIKRDSSIKAQRLEDGEKWGADDDYKVEFISPILTYSDIETVQELVRAIRKAGGFTNSTCGMHIHVGASDLTAQAASNLLNAVASKQDLIYKALKVHENRERYCKKIGERFLKELNERKPQTLGELASVWYDEPEIRAIQEHEHYDDSRYCIVNLHALFTKGTVEFRVFNGTMHAGEVKAAIQFSLALMKQAKSTKKALYRPTETDNPKYTFRCWLLRLNLNGDEFKTCRHHLLKNLEGNAAWRRTTA